MKVRDVLSGEQILAFKVCFAIKGVMIMNLYIQSSMRNSSSLLFVITKPSGLNIAGSRFSQAREASTLQPGRCFILYVLIKNKKKNEPRAVV